MTKAITQVQQQMCASSLEQALCAGLSCGMDRKKVQAPLRARQTGYRAQKKTRLNWTNKSAAAAAADCSLRSRPNPTGQIPADLWLWSNLLELTDRSDDDSLFETELGPSWAPFRVFKIVLT